MLGSFPPADGENAKQHEGQTDSTAKRRGAWQGNHAADRRTESPTEPTGQRPVQRVKNPENEQAGKEHPNARALVTQDSYRLVGHCRRLGRLGSSTSFA